MDKSGNFNVQNWGKLMNNIFVIKERGVSLYWSNWAEIRDRLISLEFMSV